MRIVETKPRFAWDCLEDRPRLKTVRHFLAAVPDEELLAAGRRVSARHPRATIPPV